MTEGKQKIALVTGASRGIGRDIAIRFAKTGIMVVANYNKSKNEAESLAEEIRKENGYIKLCPCDVGDFEQVQEMFAEIKKNIGSPDILVNNAGITNDGAFLRMNLDDWHKVINTNLNGYFYCIKAAAFDMMKNKNGRIINMSSLSSYYAAPGQANYAASKAGIIGLTRCLASEFGLAGITVNAVIPGLIPTDMIGKMPKEKIANIASKIPLRRLGTVGDITSMVEFLSSDSASYITGQVMIVDGGLSCSLGQ